MTKYWKSYAVIFLYLFTAATLCSSSITMARCTATGTGSVSAGVAKWDIQLLSPVPAENGIIKFNSSNTSKEFVVLVKNLSEVAAVPNLTAAFGTSYGDMAYSGTTYRAQVTIVRQPSTAGALAPGETATYKMTIKMPDGYSLWDGYTTVTLTATANQID